MPSVEPPRTTQDAREQRDRREELPKRELEPIPVVIGFHHIWWQVCGSHFVAPTTARLARAIAP